MLRTLQAAAGSPPPTSVMAVTSRPRYCYFFSAACHGVASATRPHAFRHGLDCRSNWQRGVKARSRRSQGRTLKVTFTTATNGLPEEAQEQPRIWAWNGGSVAGRRHEHRRARRYIQLTAAATEDKFTAGALAMDQPRHRALLEPQSGGTPLKGEHGDRGPPCG